MALIDFFDRGWRIDPQGAAYIQDERAYSYQEVGELSCRIAHALLATGLPAGAKGAVWAMNDTTAWTCTLGLWRANMAWIPVGARNTADENHMVLDSFDCEVLFFQQEFVPAVAKLQPDLPRITHWICIDGDAPEIQGSVSLTDWVLGHPATKPHVAVDLDDVVAITPTGGTTGAPKGVMNTHRSLQTMIAHVMIGCPYDDGHRPVNLAAAPMTHTSGVLSLPASARAAGRDVSPIAGHVRSLRSLFSMERAAEPHAPHKIPGPCERKGDREPRSPGESRRGAHAGNGREERNDERLCACCPRNQSRFRDLAGPPPSGGGFRVSEHGCPARVVIRRWPHPTASPPCASRRISSFNAVGLRNMPPTPANSAKRSGRAASG